MVWFIECVTSVNSGNHHFSNFTWFNWIKRAKWTQYEISPHCISCNQFALWCLSIDVCFSSGNHSRKSNLTPELNIQMTFKIKKWWITIMLDSIYRFEFMALLLFLPDIGCSQWDFHWASGFSSIAYTIQIWLFAQYHITLFVRLYFGFLYLQQNKKLIRIFLMKSIHKFVIH